MLLLLLLPAFITDSDTEHLVDSGRLDLHSLVMKTLERVNRFVSAHFFQLIKTHLSSKERLLRLANVGKPRS